METLIKNRYRIEYLIGTGGMGAVYKAYDRLTTDMVAIKQVDVPENQLHTAAKIPGTDNEKMLLANEFSILASIRHPNIIRVLDYGFDERGDPFFTMDLLENGIQIHTYAKNKSREQKIACLLDILQALRYLHQRGILHRDLKPGNVLVSNGSPKLLDFGLAMDAEYAQTQRDAAGTLAYLAPEVLRGKSPSVASDLYSFAVLAYELFTGEHPFPYETQSQLIQQVLLEEPQFNNKKIDANIAPVLLRLLSKDAQDRYATALDTIRALCEAANYPIPSETIEIRESFLLASKFVGRKDELSTLKNALGKMLDNSAQTYLIAGESGVGKTRLMDELRSLALVEGVHVIRGQAVTEAGMPYKIWRDVLPELLLFTEIEDDEVSILAHLVPDISDLLERDIQPAALSSEAINSRLPFIILDLIQRATKQHPVLLMLEDLQWAEDSIEILKAVVSNVRHTKLMIAGNYRSDEAPRLSDALDSMTHMPLQRLTEDNIKQLSSAMLGDRGESESVLDLIQRESEGNAFFIVEVVRALAEEAGQLSDIGLATLPAQIFAGGIQQVIQRRMVNLPEWALYPVQVSSIIGRQINLELLKLILPDLKIEQWLRVCGEIAIFSAIGEQWQFTHDKIREYIISNLDNALAEQINLTVAETIELHYANHLEPYTPVLAKYYHAAGNNIKAGNYAARAAEFLRFYNPPEAYRLAKHALALQVYQHHKEPEREQANLNLLLGNIALHVGKYAESRKVLDIALALYEKINDGYGLAKTKVIIGEWGFKTSNLEGAIELMQEGLPVLEAREDWLQIGFVYMNISIIQATQGDMEAALPNFQKCFDTMLRTGNEVEIAKACNNLAIASEMTGDIEKGLELHNRALTIRRRINDKNGLASSLQNLATIENLRGNHEKALEMRHEALTYAREMEDRQAQIYIVIGLGITENHMGNRIEAVSYLQEALDIAIQGNDVYMQGDCFVKLGQIHFEDNPQEAINHLYKAATIVKDFDVIPQKIEVIERLSYLLDQAGEANMEHCVIWLASTLAYRKNYENFDRIDSHLVQLKAKIPETIYHPAIERGKNMSLNDAIEQILETRESHHAE